MVERFFGWNQVCEHNMLDVVMIALEDKALENGEKVRNKEVCKDLNFRIQGEESSNTFYDKTQRIKMALNVNWLASL